MLQPGYISLRHKINNHFKEIGNRIIYMKEYAMRKCCFIVLVALAASVYADLQLNGIFKDNMVLQRDQEVSVYGIATPSSKVNVTFNGQKKSVYADNSGGWELKLDPMKKSFEPQKLVVESDQSKDRLVISNVLVGDVWLCSGQSNMEHWFETYPLLKSQAKEINNPDVRSVIMEKRDAAKPEEAVILKKPFADAWHEAREPWVMPLSPTAYFFAAKLRRDLDVPVGLIISSVGGTQIQRWMPVEAVNGLKLDSESSDGAGVLYNSMIHPLRKFTIKGVIWYQGESNGRIPHSYYAMSKEHIKSWRQVWAQNNPHLKNMPFFTVQIAPFQTTVDGLASDAWAYIRDAQLKTLSLPNTGLVVTTDLGEYADIHPQNKQPVGERLALWAEKLEGRAVVPSGPLFKKAVVDGNKMNVYFSYVGSGLETRRVTMSSRKNVWAKDDPDAYVVSAEELAGFTLCGTDMKFVPAEAKIVGDRVEVSSREVSNPVAVRYGWSTFPLCNLYNKEGLPASPFRSDNFPVPDVQGRTVGITWDGNDTTLGHALEFTGSTSETVWEQVTQAGRQGYQAAPGQDSKSRYAYYKITDQSFKSGKCPKVVLSVVYFDWGQGTVAIQYDSSDKNVLVVKDNPGAWKNGGNLKLENTLTWKKAEFAIEDGFFDGRCNSADFRLNCAKSFVFSKLYCRKR
jgi:sialate O-acetylesterase